MGQDDSCGVCGKHYQTCQHFMKEHIPTREDRKVSLCGRKNVLMLEEVWKNIDIDPFDICTTCRKLERKYDAAKRRARRDQPRPVGP